MSSSRFFSEINNVVEVLDELAERVRAAHKAVQTAAANALAAALVAGDALIEAKDHGVGSIGWERWVEAHCRVGLSTARLYMQLARGRAKIEAALVENPFLSLREARRLVAKPKKHEPKPEDASDRLVPELTDMQLIQELTARGFDWLLKNIPEEWREELQARLRGPILRAEQRAHPNTRLKNLNLRLVHSSDHSTKR